jgi:RNA polymerase sigma-70 factor (ECF subfamily)
LIERCRQGDREAWTELIFRYQTQAVQLAYAVTGDRSLADDVAQEAFIQALRAIRNVRPGAAFGPWFYRILVNQARRQLKRGRWRQWLPLDEAATMADAAAARSLDSVDDQSSVWVAVKGLPLEFRTVVALRYLMDFSEADMAAVLSVPVGTVKSRLHRARTMLRQQLSGDDIRVAKEGLA